MSDKRDIVESLRLASPYPNPNRMLRDAADEIVRLRKELKESNAAWQRALLHAVDEIERLRAALADRDASWERAIREYFDCDEAVQAVAAERERLEAEGGGA
jgi:hypothetical protein